MITVKQNQPQLHAAIVKQTQTTQPLSTRSWKQKGHGHDVKCRLQVYSAPPDIKSRWASLQRVISVNRRGERGGKYFDATTYYLPSETGSAYVFATTIRGHRKIENNLPWVKDVIFKEDQGGIRSPPQAATLGVCRNFAFNLLVWEGFHSLDFWDTDGHRPHWSTLGDDNCLPGTILYSGHRLIVFIIYLHELQIYFLI